MMGPLRESEFCTTRQALQRACLVAWPQMLCSVCLHSYPFYVNGVYALNIHEQEERTRGSFMLLSSTDPG